VGRRGRVDEYLAGMEAQVLQVVDGLARQRVAELRKELATLEAQAQLRAEDRGRALEAARSALDEWDRVGSELSLLLEDDFVRSYLKRMTEQGSPTG